MDGLDQLIQMVINLGLAVGICVYLVHWVTNNLEDHLKELTKHLDLLGAQVIDLRLAIETLHVEIEKFNKRNQ